MTPKILPQNVHSTLKKHLLVDGFDLVLDLQKSHGSFIVDSITGKEYLDFFTFVASVPIGMNHPKMKTPEFLEKLTSVAINKPSLSDIYPAEQAEFVETFSRIAMPNYFPHAFFIEGGALGIENALKAAFDWKIRKNFLKGYKKEKGTQVIHFKQAFHGRTGYTMSLTNTEPVKIDLYPKFKWPRIENPKIKFPLNEENLKAAIQAEQLAMNQIKDAIKNNPDDIAAIIIEPIQGEGGDNHFRKEFFVELRRIADENNIMLIFDEVQVGVGLTGKMWAHQHFVQPDMIAFGKKTQVCGFLCGKRIDEIHDNVFNVSSRLNSTWGGNIVDMVRAQKYLEIIEEEKLVDNARVMGEYLLKQLHNLQNEFPSVVSNARGLGLFCAFDLNTPDERNRLKNSCYDKGLIILGCGEKSMRFRPPLNISKNEVDMGMSIIREALKGL
ncbi:MAG: L-lysine 6-transaminase [Bacteroidota bacterium]|nr:L-lysine 6-transaminase [Bacteroidota bacterium]